MMSLPIFILFLAASVEDVPAPVTLEITWQDGTTEHVAATNQYLCERARIAVMSGKWQLVGRFGELAKAARCVAGNSFAPGWDRL